MSERGDEKCAIRVLLISPYHHGDDGIADYTASLRVGLLSHVDAVGIVAPARPEAAAGEIVCRIPSRREPCAADIPVANFRPDVVHVQFAVAAFGAGVPSLLRWLWRLPHSEVCKVVTLHEVSRDLALLRAPGRSLYRRIADWADVLIVHTVAASTQLAALGVPVGKIRHIPHPVGTLPPATASPKELLDRYGLMSTRIVLAFGFIHPDKGLPDLIRALALLVRREPVIAERVQLVIAGGVRRRQGAFRAFELRDRLHLAGVRWLLRRRGLAGRVTLTGHVPAGEVSAWLRAAEVAVLPYRRIEASGVAALASATGLPLLLSAVGGLAEDTCTVAGRFPPRDPEQLAAVLGDFLRVRRAAEPRRRHSEDHTLEAVVDATLAAYGQVLSKATASR